MPTDVLIIGSGMAGSVAALSAADEGVNVTLVTKMDSLISGSTLYAQGGIAFKGEDDSPEKMKADIMVAGAGHCYEPAVDLLCYEGPDLVQSLLIDRLKVPFTSKDGGDEYQRTAEAAHSVPRILHSKDKTGRVLEESMIKAVSAHPNITTFTGLTASDIITNSHHSSNPADTYGEPTCFGALFFNSKTREVEPIFAQHTILASGGLGQLYLHTTNPIDARGDGIAMAWRAGARCINLQYIQFHPTALYTQNDRFLISEAVRGEGGVLVDPAGNEFMHQYHELGSLAPRDVVARGIHQTMIDQKIPCVYLDITGKSHDWVRDRFPSIYAHCKQIGIDMTNEPIPVVPAAHYSCGGIAVDLSGETSIKRLFAIGEVSCTGLHGANRLASTSLLECVVWGHRAGKRAAELSGKSISEEILSIREWEYQHDDIDKALIAQDWETIRHIMWNYVGLIRTPRRLQRARTMLRQLQMEIEEFYKSTKLSDDIIGLRNGVQTALAILFAASAAHESRGCHYLSRDGI